MACSMGGLIIIKERCQSFRKSSDTQPRTSVAVSGICIPSTAPPHLTKAMAGPSTGLPSRPPSMTPMHNMNA